jgi:methionyl-tRNA synthetase
VVGAVTTAQDGGPFYLTVAIDYPNGTPHVGHAYEKVAADAIARYQRLRGLPTYYLMGNDEHSQNVLRAARDRGLEPDAYCAQMEGVFRTAWDGLGIAYDMFMRTNDPRHVATVRTLVQRLYDRGHVYRGVYRGWYCVSCEAFRTEKEAADGRCPVHGRPLERVEEVNWFFRLSAFRDAVLRHIEQNPGFVRPEAPRHEVLNVLRDGLDDISISRAHTGWGVPLPWDEQQVVYVWFDALFTYLSGAGFGWDPARFDRLWPADLHLIGKDITRFHCVIWPAMLLALELPLPRAVFVHGFLNLRGERLSKTTGNVIDPLAFLKTYGRDATRYYLLSETPFGQDGNFAPESFVKRYNSDLANDLGNLLHRTLTMIERYHGGEVPAPPPGSDDGFEAASAQTVAAWSSAMEDLRLHEATAALMGLCGRANRYADQQAPWELARRGARERLAAVLYNLAETLRILALGFTPFMVDAPKQMLAQLGLDPEGEPVWTQLRWGGLPAGTRVRRGDPLFARLDAEVVLADAAAFGGGGQGPAAAGAAGHDAVSSPSPPAEEAADAPNLIDIADFRRLDLRVATVVSAERVEGTTRLLRLLLDMGGGTQRQIVSGIAAHYAPEALVGRAIVVVANLRPTTIRGVRSEGMLLAAGDGSQLRLVGPDGPISPGSPVR